MPDLRLSVIIPVLNEQHMLDNLLRHLDNISFHRDALQIIVVDGGSTDNTIDIAKKHHVTILNSKKGRAAQMNTGAEYAKSDVLYFLHADTFPPRHFDKIVLKAVESRHTSGCFRMRFDSNNPILRFFAWLSRINHTLCRGGDQSLFVLKNIFHETGGFNESYLIYEDSEFIRRLYKTTNFKVLPQQVITSARKYHQKGWFRVQYHFAMIHFKNYLGDGPDELYRYYSKKLL
ncbi:TIGR04283 family arsenosugar biosynthesis glycosyltransferase [Allomuricauda sp. d1]|uniref:TIGR04283 family arsenosugar biosynthesis glycosyltransferase n=1 Tax=Allomuricauda sp. d1 TaxID=3136725 RepID=UPI0031DF2941